MSGIIKFDHRFMPIIKIKSTSTLYESATKYIAVLHNDRKVTATVHWSELSFERAKRKNIIKGSLKKYFCCDKRKLSSKVPKKTLFVLNMLEISFK